MGEKEVQKGKDKAMRLCRAFCEQVRLIEFFLTEDEKKELRADLEEIATEILGE